MKWNRLDNKVDKNGIYNLSFTSFFFCMLTENQSFFLTPIIHSSYLND